MAHLLCKSASRQQWWSLPPRGCSVRGQGAQDAPAPEPFNEGAKPCPAQRRLLWRCRGAAAHAQWLLTKNSLRHSRRKGPSSGEGSGRGGGRRRRPGCLPLRRAPRPPPSSPDSSQPTPRAGRGACAVASWASGPRPDRGPLLASPACRRQRPTFEPLTVITVVATCARAHERATISLRLTLESDKRRVPPA